MTRLDDNLRAAADRFESGVDSLADEITAQIRDTVADLRAFEAAEIAEINRRITVGSRLAQSRHLKQGRTLPDACPQADVEGAHVAAEWGVSPTGVQRAYRFGHAVSLEAWLDAIQALDLPPSEHSECLQAVTRFAVSYEERLLDLVLAEHERALARLQGQQENSRLRDVRDLVEGRSTSAEGLGYDLDMEHVGVIAWGSDAERTLQQLSKKLDRRLASGGSEHQLTIAWLGSNHPLDEEGRRALRRFEPKGNGRIAIGTPQVGLEGFRRTHRQAGDAQVVAQRLGQKVTLYEDVALEALALRNERFAREFVAEQLGRLEGERESTNLVKTLRAYFDAGQNATSAAAALHIRASTVSARLTKVEELIGAPVNSRRAELELALRLERLV